MSAQTAVGNWLASARLKLACLAGQHDWQWDFHEWPSMVNRGEVRVEYFQKCSRCGKVS